MKTPREMYLEALERAVYSQDAEFAVRVTNAYQRALRALAYLEQFSRIHAELNQ